MALSRLKIFCALHRPLGKLQIGYHLVVIICSFVSGFLLNIMNLQPKVNHSLQITWHIDLFLAVVLCTETVAQLWSSSYNPRYRKWLGKMRYLYDHLVYKTVDTLGIVTYITYCTLYYRPPHGPYNSLLSIGHLIQILQIYRLTHRQLRLLVVTLHYKFGYIFAIFLFTLTVFLVLSRFLYSLEKNQNNQIKSFNDATWLVFITIICIGFGDKGPVTIEGKLFVIFVAFFGLVSFTIIVSLLGAQLANEKEKANIVSLIPAATLIQNVWILHSMQSNYFWKYLVMPLSEKDKRAMISLMKVRHLVSRRHFKLSLCDITTFDENILLYEHLLNRLDFIEKNIYHISYTVGSINRQVKSIASEIADSSSQPPVG